MSKLTANSTRQALYDRVTMLENKSRQSSEPLYLIIQGVRKGYTVHEKEFPLFWEDVAKLGKYLKKQVEKIQLPSVLRSK